MGIVSRLDRFFNSVLYRCYEIIKGKDMLLESYLNDEDIMICVDRFAANMKMFNFEKKLESLLDGFNYRVVNDVEFRVYRYCKDREADYCKNCGEECYE